MRWGVATLVAAALVGCGVKAPPRPVRPEPAEVAPDEERAQPVAPEAEDPGAELGPDGT